VRVVTAPDAQFRTTLTQNLQADAHLTLLGTPDNPGMLGRVTVTEGDVVFFGSKYTIDQGTITFSDASKINPVLNIDLETTVQGVDVALTVSGPMDRISFLNARIHHCNSNKLCHCSRRARRPLPIRF
jgi:translocation and assembly module TamB